MSVKDLAVKARAAAKQLLVEKDKRGLALAEISRLIIQDCQYILKENERDIEAAKGNGMEHAMVDRLSLNKQRVLDIAAGVANVNSYGEVVGKVLEGGILENGLAMEKITVPMGVIGVIYESRPNVTADCAALCLKAGNAVILRGGKEAYNSNKAIADIIRKGLEAVGVSKDCVQLVSDTSRASATEMMELTGFIDLLIPRGGEGLIKAVVENSKVPVIETGVGNCHIYVDEFADVEMAASIIFNAKTSRPSVCNSAETMLVHSRVAEKALPIIAARLKEKQVEIRGCEKTCQIIKGCTLATNEDYEKEFLNYTIAAKVVTSIGEALEHIEKYSTGHSEAIITKSYERAEEFIAAVDSAAVYVNASTRFTDGSVFGLGAEIGISTQKLHARGPMGLSCLVSYKYVLRGMGQIRE